jgi:hypothetical protein
MTFNTGKGRQKYTTEVTHTSDSCGKTARGTENPMTISFPPSLSRTLEVHLYMLGSFTSSLPRPLPSSTSSLSGTSTDEARETAEVDGAAVDKADASAAARLFFGRDCFLRRRLIVSACEESGDVCKYRGEKGECRKKVKSSRIAFAYGTCFRQNTKKTDTEVFIAKQKHLPFHPPTSSQSYSSSFSRFPPCARQSPPR